MAADARRAWVLNLDADLELAAGGTPGSYTPNDRVRAAMAPFVAVLARALLGPGDILVGDDTARGAARGLSGRAFMPTPRARALLERAGALPEPVPSFDVLRRVNSRAFAASLGQTLPGAAFVTTEAEARLVLATPPPEGASWRLKRAFGMTGRNQRVIRGEADWPFLVAGLAEGGVQLEPNLAILAEYAIHGFVADGPSFGRVVVQECDARGAWVATRPLEDVPAVLAPLREEARRVASALTQAGYFGPFGVDAFVYRARSGALTLQPRSEINARYSMGYAVGMAR